jgi:hypothetical protein
MKKTDLDRWLKSGKYLPSVLRDFHDQKEVFRAMHEIIAPPDPSNLTRRPDWIEGQCYVIDVFLWFMARRGYTLQRTRINADFRDLEQDVAAVTQARDQSFAAILGAAMTKPATAAAPAPNAGVEPSAGPGSTPPA